MNGRNTKEPKFTQKRSSFRLTTLEDEPIYLQVNLGGEIHLPVPEIGGGGARLLCYKWQQFFEGLHVGQSLGKCILGLREDGMHEVEPSIRWKHWPCIGVQFKDLSDKTRADLFRFLFNLERKKIKRLNALGK